jgi:hypothetical protein
LILLAILASVIILLFFDVRSAAQSNTSHQLGYPVTSSFSDSANVLYKPILPPIEPPPASKNVARRDAQDSRQEPVRASTTISESALRQRVQVEDDSVDEVSPERVQELIRIHSASYGLDPFLPLAIAKCESGYRWDAKNSSSTAAGVFQYLSGTWANTSAGRLGLSAFDADANIRMAVTNIAVHGTDAWNASKPCWNT